MGWEYMNSGKPQIYYIYKSDLPIDPSEIQELTIDPEDIHKSEIYYSWASGSIWSTEYAGIKFINDTGGPVQINKLGIKSLSCNSGNKSFVSYSGGHYSDSSYADGYGAYFCVYILVSNDGGSTFEKLNNQKHYTANYIQPEGYNMLSKGWVSPSDSRIGQTGSFGPVEIREYDIDDCPVIQPDGIAYIMFGVQSFDADAVISRTYIKFILDPSEMEVEIDQGIKPYVWEYCLDEDGVKRWHLTKRVLSRNSSGGWDIADDIGGFNTP